VEINLLLIQGKIKKIGILMENKINIFSFLNGMTETKEMFDFDNDEIRKEYSQFMINRFVSMTDIFVPVVNQINRFQNIPNHIHYEFFRSFLPKRKQFFKYIKKEKEINNEQKECIKKYYEIGEKELPGYLEILTKEQIEKIVKKYEHGKTR